jgi:hypothetical protein
MHPASDPNPAAEGSASDEAGLEADKPQPTTEVPRGRDNRKEFQHE